MPEPLGYSRDGDIVTIRMTMEDWQNLVCVAGRGASTHLRDGRDDAFRRHLALMNRLNAGNPQWTPYEIPHEIPQEKA